MTETKNKKDIVARLIAIAAISVAVITGIYQISDYYSDKENDVKLTNIEINQLLNEARDQMGGGIEGALTIELKKPTTNKELRQLEIARRKIEAALILNPKNPKALNYLGISVLSG